MKTTLLLALATVLLPLGAARAADEATITVTGDRLDGITAAQRRVPAQLSVSERATYRQIFLDIDAGRYSTAEAALSSMPQGLLHGSARAELMLARGSVRSAGTGLGAWLASNADLPQAPRLAALGARLADMPALPISRVLRTVSFTAPMSPHISRGGGARDAELVNRLKPLLVADRNADAEAVLAQFHPDISSDAASEWAQRTAWSYYGAGDDLSAERLGLEAAKGSSEWSALGGWVAGLAAFRRGDCAAAAAAFDIVNSRFATDDLADAAAFWSARAYLACGRPEQVSPRLRLAAQHPDSFYGMLAMRALGLGQPQNWTEPDFITADWNHLSALSGAKRAAALVEIGQLGLADRELKYLAATTDVGNYAALLRLAARLNLPATQYWLAHHPPVGTDAPLAAQFPNPEWRPARGWRVDRGLVYAHALQESNFVTDATSRAGARGIMQLMPSTAKRVSARMSDGTEVMVVARDLTDPEFNIECGQTYLEELRDTSYTAGMLPKVIAAYNAGPGSIQKWNVTLRDNGDPLLFIESIPFKETRHYVEVVMRNYWMYQLRDGQTPPSIDALAAGMWPRFPGMPGATAVKGTPTVFAPLIPVLRVNLPEDTTVIASAL